MSYLEGTSAAAGPYSASAGLTRTRLVTVTRKQASCARTAVVVPQYASTLAELAIHYAVNENKIGCANLDLSEVASVCAFDGVSLHYSHVAPSVFRGKVS